MAAKASRVTQKVSIGRRVVAETCTDCRSRSWRWGRQLRIRVWSCCAASLLALMCSLVFVTLCNCYLCVYIYVYVYYMCMYTGCPRRNVPDFGRVFLMLKCTDIIPNTYVQSWTVTEIMAREKCGLLAGPHTVPVSWQSYPFPSLSVVSYDGNSAHASHRTAVSHVT